MKKLLALVIILMPVLAFGQFHDYDGHLEATWQPPTWGNPVDHYTYSYEINGVQDSLTGNTSNTFESSVSLANLGDWAILRLRSVSIFSDTSSMIVSDTAFYADQNGIGPPGFIQWVQGSPSIQTPAQTAH